MSPPSPARPHADAGRLPRIEAHFHELIRRRIATIDHDPDLELPRLRAPLPRRKDPAWFPVIGMFGGFKHWFEGRGSGLRLVVESWSRAVDGSGQRHEVTEGGCRLVEEGFV